MKPEQELQEDEEILVSVHPSPWSYLLAYVVGIFTFLPYLISGVMVSTAFLGGGLIIVSELHRRGNRYFVTNERVIREYRFLKRNSQEATLDLISDILINQSPAHRLIGIGSVDIKTASSENINLRGVKRPGKLQSEISSAKSEDRKSPDKVEIVEDEKVCPQCDNEISDSDNYCPECGANLEDSEEINAEKFVDQTISEVKDEVNSRDLDIEELIEAEKKGKNRGTLIAWLEDQK